MTVPTTCASASGIKGESRAETIYRSKAVGEPPLMLALSALSALTDAVLAAGDYGAFPRLDAPVTPERILLAVEDVVQRSAEAAA
jgi:xanthine dehydrogenase large subunit